MTRIRFTWKIAFGRRLAVLSAVALATLAVRGDYLHWQVDSGAFTSRGDNLSGSRVVRDGILSGNGGPLSKSAVLGRLSPSDRAAFIELVNYDDAVRRRVPAAYARVPYAEIVAGGTIAAEIVPTSPSHTWHGEGTAIPEPCGAAAAALGLALAALRRRGGNAPDASRRNWRR